MSIFDVEFGSKEVIPRQDWCYISEYRAKHEKLYDHQLKILRELHNNKPCVVQAGRKTGMSFLSRYYAVDQAVNNDNTNVYILSDERQSIPTDFVHFIQLFGVEHMVGRRTLDRIDFTNGSCIRLIRDGRGLRGVATRKAIFCIDNANSLDESTLLGIFTMFSANPDNNAFITINGNPKMSTAMKSLMNIKELLGRKIMHKTLPWSECKFTDTSIKNQIINVHGQNTWNAEFELKNLSSTTTNRPY